MAIAVDSAHAPRLLRLSVDGAWPTVKEQSVMWAALIDQGFLTAETRALIDIRLVLDTPRFNAVQSMVISAERRSSWPLCRAYLVESPTQFGLVRQMQALAPATMQIEIFKVESDALAWLWAEESGS
jgi:hypothetical protein